MKKIVRGYVLDTDNAQVVKKFVSGAWGDPKGYEETLYVTEKGVYFVYTNGGSESKYPVENITLKYKQTVEKWIATH